MSESSQTSESLKLRRTRTTANLIQDVYDDYYSEALAKLEKRIQSRPFSPYSFFMGVANLVSSTFIAAKWPVYYPIVHIFKSIVVIGLIIQLRIKAKEIFYTLDFCWVYNIAMCVFLANIFYLSVSTGATGLFLDSHMYRIFAIANGPLASAAVGLNNSLVFHHFQHTASLFIHFSPLVISFIFRWYSHEVNATFPGLIANPDYENPTLWEFYQQGMLAYLVWFIPFSIWQLTDGISRPARGYDTVFNYNKKMCQGISRTYQLGIESEFGLCVAYLVGHFVQINFYICVARLFWINMYINVAWIMVVALRCCWNGAKYYEYIYGKGLIKLLKKLELGESKKQ